MRHRTDNSRNSDTDVSESIHQIEQSTGNLGFLFSLFFKYPRYRYLFSKCVKG